MKLQLKIFHWKIKKIAIEKFDNLLVHYVKAKKASVIIRGLRAVSDFEYEFLMTGMNRSIDNEIETIFLMSSEKYHFISLDLLKRYIAWVGIYLKVSQNQFLISSQKFEMFTFSTRAHSSAGRAPDF